MLQNRLGQANALLPCKVRQPRTVSVSVSRRVGTVSRGVAIPIRKQVSGFRRAGDFTCRAEVVDAEEAGEQNADAPSAPAEGEVIEDVVDDEMGDEFEQEGAEEVEMTEEELEFLMEQPAPSNLQQTLYRSFVLEAACQHGTHTACIKISPAYANEGRYIVVVPHGSIPPPDDIPPEAEEKLKALEEAQEAEAQGKAPPGGRSARDLEEDLTVDMPPDELTSKGESDEVIIPSLESAAIIPEDAMFLTHEQGSHRVINAETVLATLEAVGIDNARIEIEAKEDGSTPLEFPCPDGSATVISDFVKFAGIRYAPSKDGAQEHVPKRRIIPAKIISVREGNSFIQLIPGSTKRISVGIDHSAEAPVIGCQWSSWSPTDEGPIHWRWHIAPARPYIISPQQGQAMQAEGYYQGAGDETVLVANYDQWNDENTVRFPDEPSMRKVLEFVADLSLLSENGGGGVPEGHIVAFQPSRELQLRFLRAVLKNSDIVDDSDEVPKDPEPEQPEDQS